MDNKLSELSKPVAYISRSALNELQHGNRILGRIWRDGCESDSCAAIYSQEYVSALLARIEELEATEIKPEGMRMMGEAIGAHGYIVGCLVQGRPDLALEESRKWVDAFSQAAELINNG